MRRLVIACVLALAFPTIAQTAANPVIAAAKRTATAKTATFQMSITTTIPGHGRSTLTGTGAQRGSSVKLSMRANAQGVAFKMDAVLLSERGAYVMYMRSPVFQPQLPPGKSWIRLDLTKQAANLGVDFVALVSASQTFAPLEKGVVSTKRIGREVVAGMSTTHYRAVLDIRRAARAVPGFGKQVAALEELTGVRLGRSTYHVWVAGDGRIRRIRFSQPTVAGGARGTSVQTVTFLSFNTPVTIKAPPRAQVASL